MPSTPQDLTRCTVNLTRNAVGSLDHLHEKLGYSKTDIINRALQMYEFVQGLMDEYGGYAFVVVRKDGNVERVNIL